MIIEVKIELWESITDLGLGEWLWISNKHQTLTLFREQKCPSIIHM